MYMSCSQIWLKANPDEPLPLEGCSIQASGAVCLMLSVARQRIRQAVHHKNAPPNRLYHNKSHAAWWVSTEAVPSAGCGAAHTALLRCGLPHFEELAESIAAG